MAAVLNALPIYGESTSFVRAAIGEKYVRVNERFFLSFMSVLKGVLAGGFWLIFWF